MAPAMPTTRFIYCHHVEPRDKLYTLKKKSFLIPLKYTDVSTISRTILGVKKDRRIDDYWNIVGQEICLFLAGFTQFALKVEKPSGTSMWFGKRLPKIQATTKSDHVWSAV